MTTPRNDPGKAPTTPTSAAAPSEPAFDQQTTNELQPNAPAEGLVSAAGALYTMMDLGRRKRFGNYEVVRLIGQGAMGNVFEVLNRSFDPPRREALKVIRSRLRSLEEAVKRFKAEMARMANLKHPGIVPVYHAGEQGAELFFTMSYEAGGDLFQLLKHRSEAGLGPLPADQAAAILRDIATAVDTAHRQNVVHRDLKPSNILLREDGSPVVTDFGLAVLMSSSQPLAAGSGPEGTPYYMPPEQAQAQSGAIGTWSDVYALGAILYEMLTLRPPFKGSTADDTRRLVVVAPLDPPTVYNAAIPPALEAICLKCLNKDHRQRYATAGQLAQALKEFLDPVRSGQMSVRRKVGISLAAVPLLFALIAGGYVWRQEAVRGETIAFVDAGDRLRAEGRPRKALEQYAIALQRYDALIASPWPQLRVTALRVGRARVQTRRGVLLLTERENMEANAALEEAQKELEALRSTLSEDAEFLSLLAEAYHNLGQFHNNRGTPDALRLGLEYYEKALRLRHEVCDRNPGQPSYERDLARGYGYKGDTLLALDQLEGAKDSYEKAEQIRARLALSGEVEAVCLHARDFGNWSFYHDWTGHLPEAIAAGLERIKYYQDHQLPEHLPGDYQTERVMADVTVAELQLDRPNEPAADVKKLLDAALTEYSALSTASGETRTPAFAADTARISLSLGKYHALRAEKKLAEGLLTEAVRLYRELPSDKATFDDHYRQAQGHALLAKVVSDAESKAYHLKSAQEQLEQAVKTGFKHIHRLNRDRAFDDVRTTKRSWYRSKLLEPIKKARPTYKGQNDG